MRPEAQAGVSQSKGTRWGKVQRSEPTAQWRNCRSVQGEERERQELSKVKAPASHGKEFGLEPDALESHLRLFFFFGGGGRFLPFLEPLPQHEEVPRTWV